MVEDRIVMQLFFERPNFDEVAKIAKQLEQAGVKSMIMPPEERGITTVLVVETADRAKARKKLKELGIKANEKEAILIKLDNRPGTMAESAKKISDRGINLLYAFSVAINPQTSYVLLGTADNQGAIKALKG